MSRIQLYDTTLRDGSQGEGVNFSLQDKLMIATKLDSMGFDYIEGGFPLSNPKDEEFFQRAADMDWKHAKIAAFGMTRRKDIEACDDIGMQALVNCQAPVITIVGKTWDLHVTEVLRVSLEENAAMIRDSIAYAKSEGREVIYDAEHCFDGWKANPDYAIQTWLAAAEAGADMICIATPTAVHCPKKSPPLSQRCKNPSESQWEFTVTTTANWRWPIPWRESTREPSRFREHLRRVLGPVAADGNQQQRTRSSQCGKFDVAGFESWRLMNRHATFAFAATKEVRRDHHNRHGYFDSVINGRQQECLSAASRTAGYGQRLRIHIRQ